MSKKIEKDEELEPEVTVKEKLVNEFMKTKLKGTPAVKDFELTISGEKRTFDIGNNTILYDLDLTEEEFKEKCDFLHNTKTQDAKGVIFQYRVIKKVNDKWIVAFQSDSYIAKNGSVKRNNTKLEV